MEPAQHTDMEPVQRAHIPPLKIPVDLSDTDERQRLTAPGLKAFFRIVAAWRLSAEEARMLIGGMSSGKYQGLKSKINADAPGDIRPLNQDELQRVSYVIGITKALRTLHGEDIADDWMTLPNTNRMFAGRRPIDAALQGGIPALAGIRKLLDARLGMNA